MDNPRRHLLAGIALGIAGTLLALFLIALAVAYSGAYNIAASEGHAAAVRWLVDTTMHHSVRARADADDARARLAAADLQAGAHEYKEMCEHCHGGPGVEPAGWSRGMLPRPPHMTEAATEWAPAEIAWIVGHGIKYTGMPAFGGTHDEQTLWNIAAFVDRLPAMTPDAYAAFGAGGGAHAHGAGAGTDAPGAGAHGADADGTDAAERGHDRDPGHAH